MNDDAPMQGAPTLMLEPGGAPVTAPSGTTGGLPWGLLTALAVIVALIGLTLFARRRGWRLPALARPQWRAASDAVQCERAFVQLSRQLRVGHAETKLIRRMALAIDSEPVALLICPSVLHRGAEALKRTFADAEQYPEHEIAALAAIEQRFGGV